MKEKANERILNAIGRGKENALGIETISNFCGMPQRQVRDVISNINLSGDELICRNRDGYYIADTPEEAAEYIRYNASYLKTFAYKHSSMRRCAERKFSGQICLEGI